MVPAGFRANGPKDVAAIRAISTHPIIGIAKVWDDRFPVYITPNFEPRPRIVRAGADIVGIDATPRPRDGEPVDRLIARIRDELRREVFADISTLEEGRAAQAAGATYIATTLAGYTEETAAGKSAVPTWNSFRRLWPPSTGRSSRKVASTRPNWSRKLSTAARMRSWWARRSPIHARSRRSSFKQQQPGRADPGKTLPESGSLMS